MSVRSYNVDMLRSNMDPSVWEGDLQPHQYLQEGRRIENMASLGGALRAYRLGPPGDPAKRPEYYAALERYGRMKERLQAICEGRAEGEIVEVDASSYMPFIYRRGFEDPTLRASVWWTPENAGIVEDVVFWARPSSDKSGWDYLEQPNEPGVTMICNADLYAGRIAAGYDHDTGVRESWIPRLDAYGVDTIGVTRIIEANHPQSPEVPEQAAF